ncbi:uncharacterized protein LOC133843596 [Drosophila sulfurigaster albostrigata]|uniref:uncharacterized protein LOC133843596 n=1 Tax=Drosophila sulfurigaster albostrigata TaxID=89887 RepID=UPI002D21B861|nr:uncharacterized protein LOC133843596 [Drosophila sulfurigaster albostrigata]XP_062133203.1 uncharacterized protein LOC133843596 [Drosophila sulfurigaster albostrigata]
MATRVTKPMKCPKLLLQAIQLQRKSTNGKRSSFVRYTSDSGKCRKANTEEKKKCRMPLVIPPAYFKKPDPCKTDEELTTERSLGVYMRCNPPYKPECMGPCFNEPRLDSTLYKPSKTLDKEYKKYWVDCVMEKVPKRVCNISAPEIVRRPRRKTICNTPAPSKGWSTMHPLQCRPLKPGPPISESRCIQNPLCECPKARKVSKCKINQKKDASAKRQLTRYPSFSECQNVELNKEPVTECHKKISICEVWRIFKARHSQGV